MRPSLKPNDSDSSDIHLSGLTARLYVAVQANAKSADIVSSLLGSLGPENAAPAQPACEDQPTAAQKGETLLTEASAEPCSAADLDAAPAAQPTSSAADVSGSVQGLAAVPAIDCVAGACAEDCALGVAQGLRQDVVQPLAVTDAAAGEVGIAAGAAASASAGAAPAAATVGVAEKAAAAAGAAMKDSSPMDITTAAVASEAAATAACSAVAETSAAAVIPPAAALASPLAAAEAAAQATATAEGTALAENSAAAGRAHTETTAEAAPCNARAAGCATAPTATSSGSATEVDVLYGSGPAAQTPGGVSAAGLAAGPAVLCVDAATAVSSTPAGSSPPADTPGEAAGHDVSAADQAAGPPMQDVDAHAVRGPGEGARSSVSAAVQAAKPAALDSPLLARAFERGALMPFKSRATQPTCSCMPEWISSDIQAAEITILNLAGAALLKSCSRVCITSLHSRDCVRVRGQAGRAASSWAACRRTWLHWRSSGTCTRCAWARQTPRRPPPPLLLWPALASPPCHRPRCAPHSAPRW